MYNDKNSTAYRLVNSFRTFFSTMGAPEGLWTDNQPFKAAEFQDLLREFNVSWHSSSPHYSQSNVRAEAKIKAIKKLVSGSTVGGKWDANKMAHAFRNAPRCGGGPSPAESVFGRPIRDSLPSHARSFAKEWQRQTDELERRVEVSRERSRKFYDATTHTLPTLAVNDRVLIQDPISSLWSTPGKVIKIGPNRDYLIRTPNGKEYRRNRRHLLRRDPVMPWQPEPAMTYAEAVSGQHTEQEEPTTTTVTPKPTAALAAENQPADPPAAPQTAQRNRRNMARDDQPTRQQPPRTRRPVYDVNNPNSEWST